MDTIRKFYYQEIAKNKEMEKAMENLAKELVILKAENSYLKAIIKNIQELSIMIMEVNEDLDTTYAKAKIKCAGTIRDFINTQKKIFDID
jgi:hypothetical protein